MRDRLLKYLKKTKRSFRKNFLNEMLLVGLLFFILTVSFTYPLIFVMGNSLHDEGDSVANLWLLTRNMNKVLYDRGEFFYSDDVFYPEGFYLASGELYIAETLIGLPIYLISTNPIFTYNFILILSYILSGLGMYLLVKFYTKNKYSAFLAAVIFTFCSYKLVHLFQLQLLNIQWLPFTVLFFHKIFTKNKLKYAILSAMFFSLQVLSCVYYAVFIGIFLVFYFLFIIKEKRNVNFSHIIIFVLLSLMLIMPFYSQYLFNFRSHPTEQISSSHIKDYFLPGDVNEFYIMLGFRIRELGERNIFIGYTALVLSIMGFIFVKKKIIIFYFLVGLLFLILSLGPNSLFTIFNNFLYSIPPFSALRIPTRFSIMVMFSVSILAGFGIDKTLSNMKNKRFQLLFPIVIMFLLVLEYWGYFTWMPFEDMEVYDWLSKEEGDFAIIELPNVDRHNAMYLYYSSMVHKKKLYFGITTFYPERNFEISVTKKEIPELLLQLENDASIVLYKEFTHEFEKYGNLVINSYVYKFINTTSDSSWHPASRDFKYLIIHEGNFPEKSHRYTLSFLFSIFRIF